MKKTYFSPEAETMAPEKIAELQSEKLVRQVRHAYDNVKYYRDLMDKAGVSPDDIKGIGDIEKLPFLSKSDLRESYPDGMLAVPKSEVVRVHSTSGTTGKRVIAFYTAHDLDMWEECCARAIVAAGGSKDDVCQIAYGYGLFTGGMGIHGG
ncbi:MAG: phenylacetate--CoA ligase, partial [Clostridiales bacterium]|nr:phenylacetate--CoA ligase [Clostridiales bacterium]